MMKVYNGEYEITTNIKVLKIEDNIFSLEKNIEKELLKEIHPTNVEYWENKAKKFMSKKDGRLAKIAIVSKNNNVIRYQEFDPELGGTIFYNKVFKKIEKKA